MRQLQHPRLDLCGRGGPGHWRCGPDCVLRRPQEPHPIGTEDGKDRSQEEGKDCDAHDRGQGGIGEEMLKLHIEPKMKMRKENATFYQFVSDIIKKKMSC